MLKRYRKQEGYVEEVPVQRPSNHYQRKVWEIFECPESSNMARAVAVISIVMITVSIALFIIETLPSIRNEMNPPSPLVGSGNGTYSSEVHGSGETKYFWIFFFIETICVMWFCFELICRFIVAPSKFAFIKNGPNIIDVVSIIPYFLQLIGLIYQKKDSGVSGFSSTLTVLRIVRLVRVFRIFKLSRHFKVRKTTTYDDLLPPISNTLDFSSGFTSPGIDLSGIMERITIANVFSLHYCDCLLFIYVFR